MLVGSYPLTSGLLIEFGNGVYRIRALDRLIVFELVAESIQKLS